MAAIARNTMKSIFLARELKPLLSLHRFLK
jgi:hypothetical protein